jgi:hypothetical protein
LPSCKATVVTACCKAHAVSETTLARISSLEVVFRAASACARTPSTFAKLSSHFCWLHAANGALVSRCAI